MKVFKHDKETEKVFPALNSFMVFREEYFGSLLFNSVTGAEKQLNASESYIVRLCNGRNSIRQMEIAIHRRFGLTLTAARKKISALITALYNACEITLKKGKELPHLDYSLNQFCKNKNFLSAPKNVIWDVTELCNLHCAHCLSDSGRKNKNELTAQQSMSLLDELAENKVFFLSLSGGEPFIRHDIFDILSYAQKKNLNINIATNGLAIDDMSIAALDELNIFQVQVSVDGKEDYHDRFRGLYGAYSQACEAIKRLKDIGINVSINTTVTSQNISDLNDIIDLAAELGCSTYKAIPFLPAGRGKINTVMYSLSRKDYYRFCMILKSKGEELKNDMMISQAAGFMFLLEQESGKNLSGGTLSVGAGNGFHCTAGNEVLNIGSDGTFFPCPFLKDFPLGNIKNQGLKAVWHNSVFLNQLREIKQEDIKEPCSDCGYGINKCFGGCRAAAYLVNGDLYDCDPHCFKTELQSSAKASC